MQEAIEAEESKEKVVHFQEKEVLSSDMGHTSLGTH